MLTGHCVTFFLVCFWLVYGLMGLFAKDTIWEFQKSMGRWFGNPAVDSWKRTDRDYNLGGFLALFIAVFLIIFWIWAAS
jgi:hypothetical protein